MLFIGLGTGVGSALANGFVQPMELGHLPYKKATFEDYAGGAGLEKRGKKRWRADVTDIVAKLSAALEPDYVVLGGGNAKKLNELPANARLGGNADAFTGGFLLWTQRRLRRSWLSGRLSDGCRSRSPADLRCPLPQALAAEHATRQHPADDHRVATSGTQKPAAGGDSSRPELHVVPFVLNPLSGLCCFHRLHHDSLDRLAPPPHLVGRTNCSVNRSRLSLNGRASCGDESGAASAKPGPPPHP